MQCFESGQIVPALGWTPFFHQQYLAFITSDPALAPLVPERVVSVERGEFVLLGELGRRRAVLAGKLQERDSPCVGDFVLALATPAGELTRIVHVFDRSSLFRRKAAGPTARPQSIAANVDLAIVVSALPPEGSDPHAYHHGVNPRRIERYLAAAATAPARAIVALSKADLRTGAEDIAAALGSSLGAEVIAVSAKSDLGLERLKSEIRACGTAVLVGSSGVGKSSLTNRLLEQEAQRVSEVRANDTRGRHTTTRRELFVLPSGGVLIDSPGMRELGLAAEDGDDAPEAHASGFGEIDALSTDCRFRDCHHLDEPGCAVLAAVERGEIERERLAHAHKLERELAWQKNRQVALERRAERKRGRRRQARDE